MQYQLLDMLRKHIGDVAVENWFKQFQVKQDGANIIVLLPSKFIKDWVSTHYIDELHSILLKLTGQDSITLCFDIDEGMPELSDQLCTFNNFIVGKTNEMAYTAAMQVSKNIRNTAFNPLFIYGEPGVGKSHLLSAIVNYAQSHHPKIKTYYMTAEKFMYTFIRAIKNDKVVDFKEELREANLFLVDDVQFMMGKDSTQEEFFHTFNFLKSNKCQIVLSSDKSPNELDQLAKRLRSRLGAGLTVEIHQPDYELRLSILISKAEGVNVDRSVLEFIAQHIVGNVRDLEGAWTKLTAYAGWMNQPITLDLAKNLLKDSLKSRSARVLTCKNIQETVCQFYKVELSDIMSDKREKHLTRARHIAMFLVRDMLGLSSNDIGRLFGGRDHTSVLYALEKISKEQTAFADDIETIKQYLES